MRLIDEQAVRAQASAAFRASPDLQAEFGGQEAAYVALAVAEARGQAATMIGRTITATAGATTPAAPAAPTPKVNDPAAFARLQQRAQELRGHVAVNEHNRVKFW